MAALFRVLGGNARGRDIVSGSAKANCGAVTTKLQKCRHLIATASQVRSCAHAPLHRLFLQSVEGHASDLTPACMRACVAGALCI
jgi:hypothetical protein